MRKRKVRLLQPHTHGGVKYPIGRTLIVNELQAEWMINQKIAEPVKSKTVSRADETEDTQ